MTRKIKIVQTTTIIYDPTEQDLDFYREHSATNIDQCAEVDAQGIEDGDLTLDADFDCVSSYWPVTETRTTIVEVDDNNTVTSEREIDGNNETRDYDLFPKTEAEEAAEDADEDDLEPLGEK